jgi:hypothetical protein
MSEVIPKFTPGDIYVFRTPSWAVTDAGYLEFPGSYRFVRYDHHDGVYVFRKAGARQDRHINQTFVHAAWREESIVHRPVPDHVLAWEREM